jgi:hypothetical protein
MIKYNKEHSCCECSVTVDEKVYRYSTDNFGYSLCRSCQSWFEEILLFSTATPEAIAIYFALKRRGVPAELEKNDRFKTIDIAVIDAKVNIEVDGAHHNFKATQALADLDRTLYSFKKGYLTLRIPNSLAKYHLEKAADKITEFLVVNRERKNKRG